MVMMTASTCKSSLLNAGKNNRCSIEQKEELEALLAWIDVSLTSSSAAADVNNNAGWDATILDSPDIARNALSAALDIFLSSLSVDSLCEQIDNETKTHSLSCANILWERVHNLLCMVPVQQAHAESAGISHRTLDKVGVLCHLLCTATVETRAGSRVRVENVRKILGMSEQHQAALKRIIERSSVEQSTSQACGFTPRRNFDSSAKSFNQRDGIQGYTCVVDETLSHQCDAGISSSETCSSTQKHSTVTKPKPSILVHDKENCCNDMSPYEGHPRLQDTPIRYYTETHDAATATTAASTEFDSPSHSTPICQKCIQTTGHLHRNRRKHVSPTPWSSLRPPQQDSYPELPPARHLCFENIVEAHEEGERENLLSLVRDLEMELRIKAERERSLEQELETTISQKRSHELQIESEAIDKQNELRQDADEARRALTDALQKNDAYASELEYSRKQVVALRDEVDILRPIQEKLYGTEEQLRKCRFRLEEVLSDRERLSLVEQMHEQALVRISRFEDEVKTIRPLKRQLQHHKDRADQAENELHIYREELVTLRKSYAKLRNQNNVLLMNFETWRKEKECLMTQVAEVANNTTKADAINTSRSMWEEDLPANIDNNDVPAHLSNDRLLRTFDSITVDVKDLDRPTEHTRTLPKRSDSGILSSKGVDHEHNKYIPRPVITNFTQEVNRPFSFLEHNTKKKHIIVGIKTVPEGKKEPTGIDENGDKDPDFKISFKANDPRTIGSEVFETAKESVSLMQENNCVEAILLRSEDILGHRTMRR